MTSQLKMSSGKMGMCNYEAQRNKLCHTEGKYLCFSISPLLVNNTLKAIHALKLVLFIAAFSVTVFINPPLKTADF